MLRILHVVNIMDRAGLETMLMNYYRNVDRSKIQFDFLTHRSTEGAYDKEILEMGGRIYRAPRLYPHNYIKYFKFMKSFFKEHKEYLIIHSHIDTMSAFPLLAAKLSGVPIRIAHSHNTKLDKDLKIVIKFLAKLVLPKVANIYCACGIQAGKFIYGKKSFKIIKNAIDLEKFSFDDSVRMRKRKELGVEKELVIGHVGRYCHQKNQDFLLEIIEKVLSYRKDVILFLIGKGEDENKLRDKVRQRDLQKNVKFLVDRDDVNELYQAMDVFVMPSLFEGLPVVLVEAQANGLPCLISDQISQEVLMTDSIYMKSLNQSVDEWVETILDIAFHRENDPITKLRVGGYDVKWETSKITQWYQTMYKES